MEGPRAPFENELPTVVQFLDSNLRPSEGWSITSEYPLAFADSNIANLRIIKDDEQVLSHALMRPMILKTPAGLFKVAGIGSVVTSDSHRNQGLSTKTIDSCLEAARAHGCDFAILWTSLHDFYRRMGFELGGTEVSIAIDRDFDPATGVAASANGQTGEFKFMDTNRVAPEALHRLYSQHTVTSLRTVDETRKNLQIPNTRVYTAWDKFGALKAYAIEGKGADLAATVHEWGGSVSALLALLAHIRKTQGRTISIIVPQHSGNLIRTLETKGFVAHRGYLGMIKILNTTNLFAKIRRHARNLGVESFALEERDGRFYFGTEAGIFSTDSEQDLVKLIFGPHKASEIHSFDAKTAETLESVLPINLWIWGWDSV